MIKAMIVDDRNSSIELLRWLLKENCPEITSVVSAISVREALPLIDDFEPDILFLDIQMPQETGFDLLTQVKKWNFEVIFTTAFNEYAVQAIRFSALDYLLKPVNAEDLTGALERFKAKKKFANGGEQLYRNFLQNISSGGAKPAKLALTGLNEIQYVGLEEIIYLQAERNYTRLYFVKRSEFLSSKTLMEYEKILKDSGFMRVHRSCLVNKRFIESYDKQGMLKMSNGATLEVSRRKKEMIARFFKTGQGI
jgi:two-component system, LytTR family, response regulator